MDEGKVELIKLACALVFLFAQFWLYEPHDNVAAQFWHGLMMLARRMASAWGTLAIESEHRYYQTVGAY